MEIKITICNSFIFQDIWLWMLNLQNVTKGWRSKQRKVRHRYVIVYIRNKFYFGSLPPVIVRVEWVHCATILALVNYLLRTFLVKEVKVYFVVLCNSIWQHWWIGKLGVIKPSFHPIWLDGCSISSSCTSSCSHGGPWQPVVVITPAIIIEPFSCFIFLDTLPLNGFHLYLLYVSKSWFWFHGL